MSLYTNEKKNIIVLGNTGAGKSTLISRMCETEVPIGHGLSSMTETIDCYQSQSGNSWIDTPGLLDSKGRGDDFLIQINVRIKELEVIHAVIICMRIDNKFDMNIQNMIKNFLLMVGSTTNHKIIFVQNGELNDFRTQELKILLRDLCKKFCSWELLIHNLSDDFPILLNTLIESIDTPFISKDFAKIITQKEKLDKLWQEMEKKNDKIKELEKKLKESDDEKEKDKLAKKIASDHKILDFLRLEKELVSSNESQFFISDGRCPGITVKGNRCKNSVNCHFRRIGSH